MGGYTKYKRRVLNQKVIHHKFQGIHNLNSHSALVFIMLCPHMVPSDILDSAATSKRHGQLQLLLQHAHYFFHPMLSLRSKPVNYWASNLQNHYRKHQGRAHSGWLCSQSPLPYQDSSSTKSHGLEHIRSSPHPSIKKNRNFPFNSMNHLHNGSIHQQIF